MQPPKRPILQEAPANDVSAALRVMTQNVLDLVSYIEKRDIYDPAEKTYYKNVIKILTQKK